MRAFIFIIVCLLVAVPCSADTYIVDQNGFKDFTTIQEAINFSWHGDTVIVNPGTYNENVYFNGRAITLTSTEPNDANIVESTIINPSSGYSVTFDFGEDIDSLLKGFAIKDTILCYGSSPTITKNIIKDSSSYGIEGQYNASPIISENTISSNHDRGIYYCNGPIINNIITYNQGGLAYCCGVLNDNIITNNITNDDGAGLLECNGVISNNIISNNGPIDNSIYGGGLAYCSGEILYNIISNNSAHSGGGLYQCEATLHHNIISGNKADEDGGCIYAINTNMLIFNNVIVGNYSGNRGGALFRCEHALLYNNIIAFNEASFGGGIYGGCGNSYNAFWMNQGSNLGGGAIAGIGDVVVNPFFAINGYWSGNTWIDGDYHLQSEAGRWDPNSKTWVLDANTSFCIDGGDPNSDWKPELWPHGKRINIGAYGGTPEASMSPLDIGNIADLNNDKKVDFFDMNLFGNQWHLQGFLLKEDLDRNGVTNYDDLFIFTENWLWYEP